MRGAKVTEKLAAAAGLLALSCGSNHRVSPWGGGDAPPPAALLQAPDLDAQLRAVDEETGALGLQLETELRGRLPRGGGALVVRGYRGLDALGRPTSAVRVATARGVVMAVGPLSARDLDRSRATQLVPYLVPGVPGEPVHTPAQAADAAVGAFASGTDLNGDGDPDVALRSEAGTLEVWGIRLLGGAPYPVELAASPTLALDVDADGRVDLAGRPPPLPGDPIAPDLLAVATFEDGRYTGRSAAARAYHAARAQAAAEPAAAAGKELPPAAASSAPTPAPPPDDAARLRRALERAWNAALAGDPGEEVLAALDRERVPAELRAAFAAHRARIAAQAPAARTERSRGKASGTPAGR